MLRKFWLAVSAATLAVSALALGTPAQADAGVKVGLLTCNESSGWGFVLGSSRSLKCSYSPRAGVTERYLGRISKFGVDIGYLSNAVIVWAVFAPAANIAPGALAGDYGGATGSASIGLGLGANVLIGGSAKSIALQPVSFEGDRGLNVAAGIAAMNLKYQH